MSSYTNTKAALSFILSIWHTLLSIAFIIRLRQKNLSNKLYKSVLYTSITIFISGIYVFFTNFIGIVHFNNWTDSEHSTGAFTLLITYIISFNIMQGAAYLFCFLLMYNSLLNSVYAMTTYHIFTHFFLMFIMMLSAISSMILQHYLRLYVCAHVTTAIGLVFYVLGICDIMYFLSESLFKLISNMESQKAFFISKITKFTVLTSLLITCLMIFIIAKIFVAIFHDSTAVNIIQWLIYFITEIIGTLCIFNIFAMNEKYYLFCCNKCDSQIGKFCHKFAKKNVDRMKQSEINYVSPAKQPNQNSTAGLVNILYEEQNTVKTINDGDDGTIDIPNYNDHTSYVL
eukprot:119892_1